MTKISYISVLQMFFNYIKHNVQRKSYLQTYELHNFYLMQKTYLLHTIIFLRFRQRKTSEFLQAAHCFILLHMRKSMETRIAIFIPAHRAYTPSKETQIQSLLRKNSLMFQNKKICISCLWFHRKSLDRTSWKLKPLL